MTYRGNPRALGTRRPAAMPQPIRRHGPVALPVPATVTELDQQLAAIVVHETGCRWTTSRHLPVRADERAADAEERTCSCSAVPHRKHLRELITRTGAAAPGATR